MEKLYKRLSLALTTNKSIDNNEVELYEYAIKIVFRGIINVIAVIAIGLIFNMIKECLCFYSAFFVLRKFTGGFHAKNYANCLTCSMLIVMFSLFAIKCFELNDHKILFMCVVIFSAIIVCFLAPIENENKKLLRKEKKVYKYISVFLSVIFVLLCSVTIHKVSFIAYSMGIGLLLDNLLLILLRVANKFKCS